MDTPKHSVNKEPLEAVEASPEATLSSKQVTEETTSTTLTGQRPSLDDQNRFFRESTTEWMVYAHTDPNITKIDRFIGVLIWLVQLMTYAIFIQESIKETRDDQVAVTITHAACDENDGIPTIPEIQCEARWIGSHIFALAFLILAVFLANDFIQAGKACSRAHDTRGRVYSLFALAEVMVAWLAGVMTSYQKLFSGTLVDGIAAGVGLVFVHEMGNKAYHAIVYQVEDKNPKLFLILIFVLTSLSFVPVFLLDIYL